MEDKFKLNEIGPDDKDENGINLSDYAEGKSDIYFSNGIKDDPNDLNAVRNRAIERSYSESKNKTRKKNIKKDKSVKNAYLFFIIVIVISMALSVYAIFCLNDVLAITKTKSTVTVSYNTQIKSIDDAVDLLSDNGLIKCKKFCKFFAKFRKAEVGPPYEAGVYYLNGKMGLEGMLLNMQGDTATKETVKLTFFEGMTTPEIIDKLVENEVCDKTSINSVIQSTEFSYSLSKGLKADEHVPYRLEGYLFPDTYEFYVGESASSVIKKFLSNLDGKYPQKYRTRAKQLGLSDYEVLTIASIIQKEAGSSAQMKTISSVIHNRLNDATNYPSIGCESTSDYINNFVKGSLTTASAHTVDYYLNYYSTLSTSTVIGLPAGPICNPGVDAINAALYPASTNYYFFFHDSDGKLYASNTYAENKQKIQQYAPYLGY